MQESPCICKSVNEDCGWGNQKKKPHFVVIFLLTGLWPGLLLGHYLQGKAWPD